MQRSSLLVEKKYLEACCRNDTAGRHKFDNDPASINEINKNLIREIIYENVGLGENQTTQPSSNAMLPGSPEDLLRGALKQSLQTSIRDVVLILRAISGDRLEKKNKIQGKVEELAVQLTAKLQEQIKKNVAEKFHLRMQNKMIEDEIREKEKALQDAVGDADYIEMNLKQDRDPRYHAYLVQHLIRIRLGDPMPLKSEYTRDDIQTPITIGNRIWLGLFHLTDTKAADLSPRQNLDRKILEDHLDRLSAEDWQKEICISVRTYDRFETGHYMMLSLSPDPVDRNVYIMRCVNSVATDSDVNRGIPSELKTIIEGMGKKISKFETKVLISQPTNNACGPTHVETISAVMMQKSLYGNVPANYMQQPSIHRDLSQEVLLSHAADIVDNATALDAMIARREEFPQFQLVLLGKQRNEFGFIPATVDHLQECGLNPTRIQLGESERFNPVLRSQYESRFREVSAILAEIESHVIHELGDAIVDKESRIAHYKNKIAEFLAESAADSVIPSIEAGKILLKELFNRAILEDYNNDQLLADLAQYKVKYKTLAAAASHEMRALASNASRGVEAAIRAGNLSRYTFGTDTDIQKLSQGMASIPEAAVAKDNDVILLQPVNLVPTHEVELEKKVFVDKLKTVINLPENKNKNYKILIPVNDSGFHWRLAKVQVTNGVISDPTVLWDSMKNLTPREPAYQNMQTAITGIVREVNVTIDATGIQTNDAQCMQYVVQEAFREMKAAGKALTLTANAIVDAGRDADKLLQATADGIKAANVSVKVDAPLVHTTPDTSFISVVNSLNDEKLADALHAELSVKKPIQIDFDASMARKLQASYSAADLTDEKIKVDTARKQTVIEMADKLQKEGIFAANKPVQPVLNEIDAAALELAKKYFYHVINVVIITDWKLLTGGTKEAEFFKQIEANLKDISIKLSAQIENAKKGLIPLDAARIPLFKDRLNSELSKELTSLIQSLPQDVKTKIVPPKAPRLT